MADIVSPVIEVVKLVGPTIWKYVKFQIVPKSYVKECEKEKGSLQNRLDDIENKLQSQLRGVGKIPKQEVKDWLKCAGDVILKTDEDDQFNKGGCFCNICRSKHIYERTQELKSIYVDGEKYIQSDVILVQEDHIVMKDHFMSEYEKTCGRLQLRKKDIESTLSGQLHFGKIAKEEVDGWLENAGKKLKTAQDEVSQGGDLSPSLLAKLVEGIVLELNEILVNGANYVQMDVILVNDDPSIAKGVPLYAEKCYGRDIALAEIPKCLKGDQVRRMAVWGMGGIGKTTLMKEIYNQFLNEAQFDKVIWVTVSSKLDIFQIQNEIAKQVDGMELEEKDASRRAGKMSILLQRGSYLLILDDVWEAFSDEDIGIPSESEGLKLVVTTRAVGVARQIGCDVRIKLEPLTFEESLQLFRDKVGKVVLSDDGNVKPRLKAALVDIVKECDGLPLAIVTIASTMKGMPDDQYSWVKALNQLQRGISVVKGEKNPKSILKFSYDHLKDDKVQNCFLYCALFPEDFEIPKDKLIEYWIEEGFIDQMDTRHAMICEGRVILRKLEDNCLLEFISESKVKMHDLLRDMALSDITSKSPRFFVKVGVSEEELRKEKAWPVNVEKVSLMENEYHMIEILRATVHLKYNMLTTLLMPNNLIVTIPESIFMHTPGLKVLDLSWNRRLRSLPGSISDLENLTTLLLKGCRYLKKVPSLSKCQALTKLDLWRTRIEELPDGIEMLVNLKYLNLITMIKLLPEGMLPKLFNLQYLEVRKVRVENVVALRKLEYLDANLGEGVEEMIMLLGFMQEQLQRLTSYTLQVEEALWLKLSLAGDGSRIDADLLLNDGKQICHLRSDVAWDQDIKCVNRILDNQAWSLRNLVIWNSEYIECVFVLEFNPLQTLEDLRLLWLSNLKCVFDEKALGLWGPPSSSHSFLPLKSIFIEKCPVLKRLFSPALLRGFLQNLEMISVSDCDEIEEILSFTFEEEEAQIEEKLTLPKLKTLILKDLPKLKSICSSNSVLICDSLEVLEIRSCLGLNKISLCLPQLDDVHPSSLLSLKKIKVDSEKWWRFSTEWCHPKDMLLPFCEFERRLPTEVPGILKAAEALLKLIGKTILHQPSNQGPIVPGNLGPMWRNLLDILSDTTNFPLSVQTRRQMRVQTRR